jgi:hypothetical protein
MFKKKSVLSFMILSTILILIVGSIGSIFTHSKEGGNTSPYTALAASKQEYSTYLPLLASTYPLTTIFGIQMSPSTAKAAFDDVLSAKTSWLRFNNLIWSDIEPNEGDRVWGEMASLEEGLIKASSARVNVILSVRSTPAWAQAIQGSTCGPIKPEELTAFGQFMYDSVARYHQPPYNVKYWEIWNEPDVAYSAGSPNTSYGCWGDAYDDYFGGGDYAEVLKVVYPMMKAADPEAQVMIGGLLLDCDNRPESNFCEAVGNSTKPPKFLEGILMNGGGNYFDGVSFHGYDYFAYWAPQVGQYSNNNWGSAWNTTGPVSSAKADFVRYFLDKYGVTGKFIMNTEAAIICGPNGAEPGGEGCEADPSSAYEQTKARYVTQEYASAIVDGLVANTWYSLTGWRNSALINSDLTPRPAFIVYEFARTELKDAVFTREVTDYPNVRVYEFQRGGKTIWLLWSLDGGSHTISLPGTPHSIYDYMGTEITPASSITITVDPIFINWSP